jgi:integrase/recombinase XerC
MQPSALPALPFPAALAPPAPDRLHQFYEALDRLLETWVQRHASPHTQRAYRQDILSFVRFLGLTWPEDCSRLLATSVPDVQRYRDWMLASGAAPKTINRRISSLSGFYRYLGACAAELRLPVNLPNPAHAQFIARSSSDPVDETRALSAAAARQLLGMPGQTRHLSARAMRDRAILHLYLYTGIRLATGCRLQVDDFHDDPSATATLRLREKGGRLRIIGLHAAAAQALRDYLVSAGVTSGPLFRPLQNPKTGSLADRSIGVVSMYSLLLGYLRQLPGALQVLRKADGVEYTRCLYTPHSLRATTATLLLESGVEIGKVQELLGHRHITTTQIYDKRRRSVAQGASHQMPL